MNRSGLQLYTSWTDAALLEALRTDDEGAFGEIYHRYCYRLFTVAYCKLKSREMAEELVQDLFEALWSKRATMQVQQLESYLLSAIRYRIINCIKTQRVKAGYELYCRLYQQGIDQSTEKLLAAQDLSTALQAGLDRLPEKSREVFRLSRLENHSVPEISVRLQLSEKAIEYHITKSLKILRTYLRDFLLTTWPIVLWLYFLDKS